MPLRTTLRSVNFHRVVSHMLDSMEQWWNFCSPFPPDLWWIYTEVSTHIPWSDYALAHCNPAILQESDWKLVQYTVINPSKECTLLDRFTKRLRHFNTVMLVRTCITVIENHDRQQLEEGKNLFGLYLHFTVSQWRKSGQELLRHELSKSQGRGFAPHGSFILVLYGTQGNQSRRSTTYSELSLFI